MFELLKFFYLWYLEKKNLPVTRLNKFHICSSLIYSELTTDTKHQQNPIYNILFLRFDVDLFALSNNKWRLTHIYP